MSEPSETTAELEERLARLADLIEKHVEGSQGRTVQTVIHRSEGLGHWSTAAIVACFATWVILIFFAMEIHDLRAWKDIHQNHINALESKK